MNQQNMISIDEALDRIISSLSPVAGYEYLSLKDATGRIAARDIISPLDVPPHRNSAMDGYAVAASDLPADGEVTLEIVGQSFAGVPYTGEVTAGQCVRIMTGAVVPAGTDTVIMQEQVQRDGDTIRITCEHAAGQNVRMPGEDIRAGDLVIEAGRRLGIPEIGLAASLGIGSIEVRRKLRVAICSTGDELCSPGETLGEGDIYDSNRPILTAALQQPAIELLDLGLIPDNKERVREVFREVSAFADVLITSGGVSVGEADFVKEVLDEIGQVDFWKIAMKPGKPLAYGKLGNTRFFGLPGNPVSTLVTFREFVQPALNQMCGALPRKPLRFSVPLTTEIKRHPGRTEFQRGILSTDEQGRLSVASTGRQGSHILSSAGKANCFIILPAESTGAAVGELVTVEPQGERL